MPIKPGKKSKKIGLYLIISIWCFLIACEEKIEINSNWIKIFYLENTLDSNRRRLTDNEVILASKDKSFIIRVHSQLTNDSELKVYKQVDGGEWEDLIYLGSEIRITGSFTNAMGSRHIHSIPLTMGTYHIGQVITYEVRISCNEEEIIERFFVEIT